MRLRGPDDRVTELRLEILEDGTPLTRIRLESAEQSTEIAVHHLLNPDVIEARSIIDAGGEWPMRGGIAVDAKVELQKAHPVVQISIDHRMLLAHAKAAVDASGATRWTTEMTASVRGRSFIRPLVAIALLLARSRVRREVEILHVGFASAVDTFNARLAEELGGQPTSERIADFAMREFLKSVA
jgi:hypothetical protein